MKNYQRLNAEWRGALMAHVELHRKGVAAELRRRHVAAPLNVLVSIALLRGARG